MPTSALKPLTLEASAGLAGGYDFANDLFYVVLQQLQTSSDFKKARMARIRKYEDLYAGKSQPRLRTQFDAVLPVFAGMVDTLETEFDEPPYLKFKAMNPAYYYYARKYQAAWEAEAFALTANANWALKARWDKHNAILSGRGILKFYSESDPEYKSYFDAVNYRDFHCEPNGGGHLENHIFAGQESVFRTLEQLLESAKNGIYNIAQVEQLRRRAASQDYKDQLGADYRGKMGRFIALGQDPASNSYVGQSVFNLCEWVTEYKGKRWYVLFDPFTKTWLRIAELSDIFSGNHFPWVSWATHEDDRVFWSKSYGDDFYPSAQTIVDFILQEWTNRNKRMMGPRLYDPSMIVDPEELNLSFYQPDKMVEVDTKGGARHINEAIYQIPVNELGSATIDLVNYVETAGLRQSGAQDLTQVQTALGGGKSQGGRANVAFALLQQAQKRIGHKAHSYSEAYSQIGLRYMDGLDDNFKGTMPLKILGPNGYEIDTLTRADLAKKSSIGIRITSKREEDQENVFGKNQKMQSITLLAQSPNINSRWRDEHILRDIGGWSEEEIQDAMNVNEFLDEENAARAAQAIELLLEGKTPLMFQRATVGFMEKIYNYALDRKEKLTKAGTYEGFLQYVKAHVDVASRNTAKLALDIKTGKKPMPGSMMVKRTQVDNPAPTLKTSGTPTANMAPRTRGAPAAMQ